MDGWFPRVQGAAHMISEHIKLAALYDPIKEINLTEPRRLSEGEVIDAVEKLCTDSKAWKAYGSIGLKTGINFFWGPGIEPPPPGEQVEVGRKPPRGYNPQL